MTIDIQTCIATESINHGSVVVSIQPTGTTSSHILDKNALHTPLIADIESKYDNRFDDPSYYGGAS